MSENTNTEPPAEPAGPDADIRPQPDDLEERIHNVEQRELRLLAAEELRKRDMGDYLIQFVKTDDADAVAASVDTLERAIKRAVDEAIVRRLNARPPQPPKIAERPAAITPSVGMTAAEAREYWKIYDLEARSQRPEAR